MNKTCQGCIIWFRKGLRLHDNPAFLEACRSSKKVYPVFILDPHFSKPYIVGVNRYSFLLETLSDLDSNLRKLGSRLYIIRGKPDEELPILVDKWNIDLLTYESDTEPYARNRDARITEILQAASSIRVSTHSSHTLFHPEAYLAKAKGNILSTYQSFQKIFAACGPVRDPLPTPTADEVPPVSDEDSHDHTYDIPTLQEIGYTENPTTSFRGGESEALTRLQRMVVDRPQWVASFEKPHTHPNSLEPSTTVLSPYLKFGCLSAATFYHALSDIYNKFKTHSSPPVSLDGQLLWREFFYFSSYVTPNFDKMEGNARCKQIPWGRDHDIINAWKEGRTGYPFIDAIMTQLRVEGWIHHLARHAVACFLTRGDLWQHWEEGVTVFDLYLLDDDWALNNANWQWLSCSNFFYQYFRCYSPVAFGKKTDPDGAYIRKWLPQLAKYPTKFIYEPWNASKDIQRQCGCMIGSDYPAPIVEHEVVSKVNMNRMKAAYDAQGQEAVDTEHAVGGVPTPSSSSTSAKSSSSKKRTADTSSTQSESKYFKPTS